MPTIKKAEKAPRIDAPVLSAFSRTEPWKNDFAHRLGIMGATQRNDVIDRFNKVFAAQWVALRKAELGPILQDYIAALSEIREKTEALSKSCRRLRSLGQVYVAMVPGIGFFEDQVAAFHNQLATTLLQMRGQPNKRGGARKAQQADAKETARRALCTFFEMNALDTDGGMSLDADVEMRKLRVDSLQEQDREARKAFIEERDNFVAWVIETTELLPRQAGEKSRTARKTTSRRKRAASSRI